MLNLYLNRNLLDHINKSRGSLSRASYIIQCIYYISKNNINLLEVNEEENNDKTINTVKKGREGKDSN